MATIIPIAFKRHDGCIMDHLGYKLVFMLVETEDGWKGTIEEAEDFDF